MGKLDGKVCIVTGASRGIGEEIARLFAVEGGRVACVARTLHEGDHIYEGSLERTVASVREAGGEAIALAANLSEYDECVRMVEEVRAALGPIDVLVNNAALTYYLTVLDTPRNRWERSRAVNLDAPLYLSQLVLPDMLARKGGSIVMISSGAAIGPGRGPYAPDNPARKTGNIYGAQKAFMERLTQGLAYEVWEDGVSVTCVSPSVVVPTPGTVHHHLVDSIDDPKGEPIAYMAQAALLLATEPQQRITGRVCYSQEILAEYGLLANPRGRGVETKGTGYSQT
jgi:NAD(P)-dependent dehydrogenase (short-subunit alcohol dehydrogenase family)